MDKWMIRSKILEFKNLQITIPNGTVNKSYNFTFEDIFFLTNHINKLYFSGIEEIGLSYDQNTKSLQGIPSKSGNFKVIILFKIEGEQTSTTVNEKEITFLINPDPKSLWKDIPSDTESIFWKVDDRSMSQELEEKSIVVSSKRGRSHKNVGSYRDDDFAFKQIKNSKWNIIAVSDGAGSATFSRKGSQLICNEVVKYFEENIVNEQKLKSLEEEVSTLDFNEETSLSNEVLISTKKTLYKAVIHSHEKLNELALQTYNETPHLFDKNTNEKNCINSFHSTLVFTAFKKFANGYVFLSFSVGDCPACIISKDKKQSTMLNWLDIGEFGGGTRFITQRNIFYSEDRPMATRFSVHFQKDFSFLFLMSDGIYDPKFEVEANLNKIEKWNEFIEDLQGLNESNITIDFNAPIKSIENNLNDWMDFWSRGNHDDRTLAIIF
ncbi:protein phosphatase 2C domain-containing protein [uncultured Tenacibaculum sp.]|uniref:protein phosphatase 2C domain-containing protein n=1 Tax=uncultured Tenacibaculum sp. TaxID=174713 RepID=UPI0026187BA2|nr:protein phosphatase 2C domain-containing protein [uncultured Tenacibaculum sp.]